MSGCVLLMDDPGVTVGSVAEARAAILDHALETLGGYERDPDNCEHLRLRVEGDGPTWDDLTECEVERTYDPADPRAGMTCSYLLYQQGGLDGVGGPIWTYSVTIWATAPPEVWDHPADERAGQDNTDDLDNASRDKRTPSDGELQVRKGAT